MTIMFCCHVTLGNVLAIPDFDTLKHLMIKDVNKIQSNFHSIWKSTYSCFHIKKYEEIELKLGCLSAKL